MQLTRPNVQCSATLIPGLLANRSSTNTQHTVRLDNEYRPADVRGVGIYTFRPRLVRGFFVIAPTRGRCDAK